jgi:hypothetical protein
VRLIVILSVEIAEGARESLEQLRRRLGVSYEVLFNDAVSLLCWAAKQREQQRLVASVDEDSGTYRKLLMTSLENAATHRVGVPTLHGNAAGKVKVIYGVASLGQRSRPALAERRLRAQA